MKTALKKAFPASFGASLGSTIAQMFYNPETRGVAAFLSHFLFTFAITAILVTVFFGFGALSGGTDPKRPNKHLT